MTEAEYRKQVFPKANKVKTKEDLSKFIDEVTGFDHGYGTIVIGCAAVMKAAFRVVDNSPNGGITGFQAGCLGWEMIKEFMSIDGPAKIIDYDKMLYPQSTETFERVIKKSTWEHIQKKANENLDADKEHVHPNVLAKCWEKKCSGS